MQCPNCGGSEWFEGAEGGGAQNVKCAKCGARYNNTPFGLVFLGMSNLPYIVNTHTGEREEFPTLGAAMHEAKIRDEDIFKTTGAPTLSECPHWLALDEDNVLTLDVIPAWRYFHPDRALL